MSCQTLKIQIILLMTGLALCLPRSQAQELHPATCPENQLITVDNVSGVIFSAEHRQLLPVDAYAATFKPDPTDILLAEELIRASLPVLDSSRAWDGKLVKPVIRRNYENYHRQYFGLVSLSGHRVLWVNFLWSGELDAFPEWECRYIPVIEGDTWVWSIYVDLETQTCYKLKVGGI